MVMLPRIWLLIIHVLCPEILLKILSKIRLWGRTYSAWIDVAVLNDGFVDPMNPYLVYTSLVQRDESGVKMDKTWVFSTGSTFSPGLLSCKVVFV